ncbi:MAG: TetR/AcrR family transcriptional regulator [Hymenobacter sp.]
MKSVSMDDVAAELGMSKKTLYKTFANKDEIVLAVITQHLGQVAVRVRERGPAAPPARRGADALTSRAGAEQQFSDIHPSIFHDLRKYHPAAWLLFSKPTRTRSCWSR